jgi:hypothetical protein
MATYRERLQNSIFLATGTRDALDVPWQQFERRGKIKFEKTHGNPRLINGRIQTGQEAESFAHEVATLPMP